MASIAAKVCKVNCIKPCSFILNNAKGSFFDKTCTSKVASLGLVTNRNRSTAAASEDVSLDMNELPPPAKFIKLSEGTAEDFKATQLHFSKV